MSERTRHLDLPLLAAAQAQKHVTHNEALLALDALVQISVLDERAAPPAAPAEGDRHLVASPAAGAFAGFEGRLAILRDGAWRFVAPGPGWIAYVAATGRLLVHEQGAWGDGPFARRDRLGINAEADAVDRLAVSSSSVLFSHAGEGVRAKLNKSAPAQTASLLFQTNWSGRAEIGLAGDDDLRLKVSTDGATWRDAFQIDAATGAARFPNGLTGARVGAVNLLRNASLQINQRNLPAGTVTLAPGVYGHDGFKAGAAGAVYTLHQQGADWMAIVTAGSLVAPVEATLVEPGLHVLHHDGDAPARVWQGSAAGPFLPAARSAGGLVVGPLAADRVDVEFSVGSILRPQLEAGATPTPFERRLPSVELAFCQRYFVRSGGTNAWQSHGVGLTTPTKFVMNVVFPVPMRLSPTLTVRNLGQFRVTDGILTLTPSEIYIQDGISLYNCNCDVWATISGGVAGRAARLRSSNAALATLDFSAEL